MALTWTGIVNGQPFLFPDSTNYIRAADAAVYIASGHRIATAWTQRYASELGPRQSPEIAGQRQKKPVTGNDIASGTVMSGRSPYLGMAMYLGYITSDFWAFVVAQGIISYILIVLSMKRFGVNTPAKILITVLSLSALTALPTYNSLLLADAFAAFGIIAFLLLATPGLLSRSEQIFLFVILCCSVTFHLTHLMMLIGMVLAAGLIGFFHAGSIETKRTLYYGIAAILIGIAALQITSVLVRAALGRPPQLLPLLTGRFIDDGPGLRFIDEGCNGQRFQVCRIHIGRPVEDNSFLFSNDPESGAYALATPAERRLMGQEDTAFALAVWRKYPWEQSKQIGSNVVKQLLFIDYDGLNQRCFLTDKNCWSALPERVREQLRQTPSGRNLWPQATMNMILYAVVIGALAYISLYYRSLVSRDPEGEPVLRSWFILASAAMLVCAIFGGAVADPQYRYQGRLIWLVPFLALLLYHRLNAASPTVRLSSSACA